jgi:hypothetical protein
MANTVDITAIDADSTVLLGEHRGIVTWSLGALSVKCTPDQAAAISESLSIYCDEEEEIDEDEEDVIEDDEEDEDEEGG